VRVQNIFQLYNLAQDMAVSKEEVRVTRAVLDAAEIRGIRVGPSTLDFGYISAAAASTQSLCVSNTLQQPVHIIVDTKCHQHLADSTNCSQVRHASVILKQTRLATLGRKCIQVSVR
jgi:hypothetical protein